MSNSKLLGRISLLPGASRMCSIRLRTFSCSQSHEIMGVSSLPKHFSWKTLPVRPVHPAVRRFPTSYDFFKILLGL